MRKALLDTCSYLDIVKAGKHRNSAWAQNTLHHLIQYRSEHERLSISAFTVFEILDGIYRDPETSKSAGEFVTMTLPNFEVFYPNHEIIETAANINAALANSRQSIGIVDTLIAATAIHHDLILVSANSKHFQRAIGAGFPLQLSDWRSELH